MPCYTKKKKKIDKTKFGINKKTKKKFKMTKATAAKIVKNPNTPEEDPLRSPKEILDEIEKLDVNAADVLAGIRGML